MGVCHGVAIKEIDCWFWCESLNSSGKGDSRTVPMANWGTLVAATSWFCS